ncbi:MAG: HAD family hydrolase [Conexivisphaera sp.]
MAKLPWIDMVSLEPCGVVIDCRGGLRDYVASKLGDAELAAELTTRAFAAARSISAPYGSRLAGGLKVAMELSGSGDLYSEEIGRGLVESMTEWAIFPDSKDGLALLRESGYRVAIISGIEGWILERILESHGISVDSVRGSDPSGPHKPSPRVIFSAYKEAGVPIWRGLHAGSDVEEDIRPAIVLGLRTAWVNRYGDEEPEEGIASEYIVGSLGELADQLAEGDEGRNLDGWLEGGDEDKRPRPSP